MLIRRVCIVRTTPIIMVFNIHIIIKVWFTIYYFEKASLFVYIIFHLVNLNLEYYQMTLHIDLKCPELLNYINLNNNV